MNIDRIHHVAVICSDYETSKAFYTEILGGAILNEAYREERDSYKLDIAIGISDQIELFTFPDAPKRPSYPEALGLRHLAFEVPELDTAVEELIGKGVEPEPIRVDELTGKRFTFFKDPDGLPIELYEV
jgi:glyoxylase I family protein